MARIAPACLAAALAPSLAGAARPCPRFSPPGPVVEARLDPAAPPTIVALGSSSAEGAGAVSAANAYPARLGALLRAALPGRELRVVNAGRSGETSAQMLGRLERDVLAHRPGLAIWQAGGNEALRGGDPDAFASTMREGLRRLSAAGVPVVLLDNQRSPRLVAAGQGRFDAVLERLSRLLPGVGLFPRGAWHAAAPEPEALVAADGLHYNDAGYACLAGALAGALLPALRPPSGGDALALGGR